MSMYINERPRSLALHYKIISVYFELISKFGNTFNKKINLVHPPEIYQTKLNNFLIQNTV